MGQIEKEREEMELWGCAQEVSGARVVKWDKGTHEGKLLKLKSCCDCLVLKKSSTMMQEFLFKRKKIGTCVE